MKQLRNMQVVVLMGGLGTRLGQSLPKAIVNVCGKPFFSYQLNLMKHAGFRNFLFCVGYKEDYIRNYFQDGRKLGVDITYSSDGGMQLGTGGAIRKALPYLTNDFMLINGDEFMDVDYFEIMYSYFKTKAQSLMVIYKNRNRYDKSNVVFRNGELIKYTKRNIVPEMYYIHYGIGIFDKRLIERVPERQAINLSDIYQDWITKKIMKGYEVRNRFYDVGTPQSLEEFRQYAHERFIVQKPAIFLDRDGTLNREVYNKKIKMYDAPERAADIELLPGVVKALKILKAKGYRLVVVTNQPAAAKGKLELSELYAIRDSFLSKLAKKGIHLDGYFMCPHHSTGISENEKIYGKKKDYYLIQECDCRKPKPGMLEKAINVFGVQLNKSYMVGNTDTDVIAGQAINVESILLGKKIGSCQPNYTFKNLLEVSKHVSRKN